MRSPKQLLFSFLFLLALLIGLVGPAFGATKSKLALFSLQFAPTSSYNAGQANIKATQLISSFNACPQKVPTKKNEQKEEKDETRENEELDEKDSYNSNAVLFNYQGKPLENKLLHIRLSHYLSIESNQCSIPLYILFHSWKNFIL